MSGIIKDTKYWNETKLNYDRSNKKIEKQMEYFKKKNIPKRFTNEKTIDYISRRRAWIGYRKLFQTKLRNMGIDNWDE